MEPVFAHARYTKTGPSIPIDFPIAAFSDPKPYCMHNKTLHILSLQAPKPHVSQNAYLKSQARASPTRPMFPIPAYRPVAAPLDAEAVAALAVAETLVVDVALDSVEPVEPVEPEIAKVADEPVVAEVELASVEVAVVVKLASFSAPAVMVTGM